MFFPWSSFQTVGTARSYARALQLAKPFKNGAAMTTRLTITSQGQVTLPKEVLTHLGVRPSEKVEIALLPGGRAEIVAAQPLKLHGLLEGKTNGKKLSIEEINESVSQAAKKAWRTWRLRA